MAEALQLTLAMVLHDQISDKLGGITGGLGKVGAGALAVGGLAVAGIGAMGAVLLDAGKAAAAEEVGVARLGAAVKASGGDWKTASGAIETYLAAETRRTGLDDGEGRASLTRLMGVTKDSGEAMKLLSVAQDMAAAKGIDLKTATEAVGKVFMGNTATLKQFGIEVKDMTAEEIAAGGPMAALTAAVGGQAEAFGNTAVGSQKKFDVAMGNLKETVGTMVLPIMAQFANVASDLATRALPYVEQAVEFLQPVFTAVFGWIRDNVVPIVSQIIDYIVVNWPAIYATIEPIMRNVWTIISTILELIKTLWDEYGDEIIAIVVTVFNYIGETVQNVMTIIQGIIQVITSAIKGDWEGVWTGIKEIFSGLLEQIMDALRAWVAIFDTLTNGWITNTYNSVVGWIRGLLITIVNGWNNIVANVRSIVTGLWEKIFAAPIREVTGALDAAWIYVAQSAIGMWNGIMLAIKTIVGGFWTKNFEEPLGEAWFKFSNFTASIRQALSGMLSGLHIPMPHIEIHWQDVAVLGRIPSGASVNWYGRGGDFMATSPMLIGVGESGPERVRIDPVGGGQNSAPGGRQYTLIYNDYRPGGGAPDMLAVAQRLEWQARMAGA